MAKRWTTGEEQALLQGVGVYGLTWFRQKCGDANDWPNAPQGRSRKAVYSKARRLYGSGGLTRGAYSVNQIIRITGYSRTQIRRAMKALAQKWKRLSPRGAYLIYEEQFLDLCQWLGTDYWAPLHRRYNCIWCHKTKFPHKGKGLCVGCYRRYVKWLERSKLPRDNKKLLVVLKKRLERVTDLAPFEKLESQLIRGRAVPESIVVYLQGAP